MTNVVAVEIDGARAMTLEWDNEWPPPERMTWLVGRITGATALLTDDGLDQAYGKVAEQNAGRFKDKPMTLEEIYKVTPLQRTSCSTLDDETAAHPHIARGAIYEPVPKSQ